MRLLTRVGVKTWTWNNGQVIICNVACSNGIFQASIPLTPLWRQVLKYEVARQPDALGSTVFGYNDAYARLKPFLLRWRPPGQQGLSPSGQQRPYLVSVDITRAFDSIDTELMLAIVAPVLQSHEYLIFRYLEVILRTLWRLSMPKTVSLIALSSSCVSSLQHSSSLPAWYIIHQLMQKSSRIWAIQAIIMQYFINGMVHYRGRQAGSTQQEDADQGLVSSSIQLSCCHQRCTPVEKPLQRVSAGGRMSKKRLCSQHPSQAS